MSVKLRQILFLVLVILCLVVPYISSAVALSLGLLFGVFIHNPYLSKTKVWTPKLMSYAIIGLGAGMNLQLAFKVGAAGFVYTAVGISLTLLLGMALGKAFKQNDRVSALLSVGTAICGGSAIAAVAPVIRAKQEEISIALGIVFLLNAAALFIFPPIGHALSLTQEQFGVWAALAIHDTSSVVGATLAYGDQALKVGTTVKLARALWIVPVTLLVSFIWSKFRIGADDGGEEGPRKYPWFILGFILMAALYTWLPQLAEIFRAIEYAAKRVLVLALFLIGANINLALLKNMGIKPALQGALLWIIIASSTLIAITLGIISPL